MIKIKSSYILSTVVAIALAGSLFLTGCSQDNGVAKVGNESVTKQEYAYFLSYEKQRIITEAQQAGSLDPKADAEAIKKFWETPMGEKSNFEAAKEKALDYAKEFKIQLIKAKESNVTVEQAQLDEIYKNLDDYIANNKMTPESFKEMYGINVDEFKKVYESVAVVSEYAKGEQEKIQISDDDIKTAYEAEKDTYDKVTVTHVLFKTTAEDNKTPLSADKIAEAKKKAEDTLAKVKAGGDIKALAKELSEDPGVKENGGEYTFGKNDSFVEEFKNWAFSAKVGDSGIVESAFGYHVMKLDKKTGLDEAKVQLTSAAKSKKYTEMVEEWKKDTAYDLKQNKSVYDSITLENK